ncbi:thermonuclease family protein [Elioraea rosea]|uniref:thermonuclease family protein n=1 Tax=Elioraea rosea TaxID=2492390 RepID=UPI001184D438|nr:thermonuclease family protein [Elioraea rosea]
MRFSLALVLVAASASVCAASAGTLISGRPSVVDGDTLEIDGTLIRLHAIDAPELRQTCLTASGETWPCGQDAAEVLHQRVRLRIVHCMPLDRDRYGRLIGRCTLDSIDLGGWMVRQGWALAFRRFGEDYVGEEAEAQLQRRGMWAGRFTAPWDWRTGIRN